MFAAILQTKLYTPPPRPDLIPRPRLIERLDEGLHRKLTLISAGAGFGKTTLTSEWVAVSERPTAWLSLDEGDNDLSRFLTYFVAALQTVTPNLGEQALTLLQSPQPPAADAILTLLLNEIAAVPEKLFLVLDDYHVIESPAIDEALTFLLDHLPPQMHLVITTREDPNLPLARYRVRGQLTELRAADLRFTPDEATEFLNQAIGLNLSAEEIGALESRTEGWIAGLQMAALSMQGRPDTVGFIEAFTGSHRFVLDYLAEEVLQSQSKDVRNFLLQTSILNRLNGALCDAVTGQAISGKLLETLEQANLFIVPLDNQRQWYRYHHLFAEVLQIRALEELETQVLTLHRRASDWYEENGMRTDAIVHALAAQDVERSADLVEITCPELHRSNFRSAALLEWLNALPDDVIHARPMLSLGYAWELLNYGQLEAADGWLQVAERWLTMMPDTEEQPESRPKEMVVVDDAEFALLPAEVASARAYHALAVGNMSRTIHYAQQALSLLSEDAYIRRGPAASLLGLAYWRDGDLEAAYQTLADGMASFEKAGNIAFSIAGTFGLADIRLAQGRLQGAMATYERALRVAKAVEGPTLQGTADLYLGFAELYHEQGKIDAAAQYLQRSETLGEQAALTSWPHRLCLVQARMKESEGDLVAVLDLLGKAERLLFRTPVPDTRPIPALRAKIWSKLGRLTEAHEWVRTQDLSVEDDLSYMREFEHMTLARILIIQHKNDHPNSAINQAIGLLERLLQAAEEGERTRSVIEILILQALAHEALADIPAALVPLERALTFAESEGYVRIFIDEREPMMKLLREAAKNDIAPTYVHRLLTIIGETTELRQTEGDNSASQPKIAPQPSAVAREASPIEPLSDRELDVLRLLRTELSGPEIAHELVISLNTFRTHSKNIYSKLGVNNRRAAVRRGTELDLL